MFEAADRAELEEVLLSMPLRVWRTDDVLPLSPHPNDPGREAGRLGSSAAVGVGSEFLTTFTLTVPPGTRSESVDATTAREADRARELAGQGRLLRLWTLAGNGQSLGLWIASDDEMQTVLASLPLGAWMRVETIKLAPHPNDPALRHS
jgi:muconolactone delta-isomerase